MYTLTSKRCDWSVRQKQWLDFEKIHRAKLSIFIRESIHSVVKERCAKSETSCILATK
jgi:hypothetical protein